VLQSPPRKRRSNPRAVVPVATRPQRRTHGSATNPPTTQNTPAQRARGARDLRMSLVLTYDLWLASWETALAAVATATRSRTLSTTEAAAHNAVVAAERELVTKHFTLLLGRELPRRRASDDGSIRRAAEPFNVG
jgi:hypothetical protein